MSDRVAIFGLTIALSVLALGLILVCLALANCQQRLARIEARLELMQITNTLEARALMAADREQLDPSAPLLLIDLPTAAGRPGQRPVAELVR